MGYQAKTAGGVSGIGEVYTSGLGTDTSAIDFKASEDLGGGYKANIALGLDGINRAGAPAGQNAVLTLATPVVGITLATAKSGDYLSTGLASQGFFYYTWDEKIMGARTSRDSLTFTAPIGDFTASYSFQEAGAGIGLGAGMAGESSTTGQGINVLSVSYAKAALSVNATYLSYLASSSLGATKDVYRLSGKYDLGAVALGLGAEVANANGVASANPKSTGLVASIVAPVTSQLSMGAEFASRNMSDVETVGGTSGTLTGMTLQGTYALSKRTSVIAAYARWTQAATLGTTLAATTTTGRDASSGYSLLLSHSF
jgi:predicted porin